MLLLFFSLIRHIPSVNIFYKNLIMNCNMSEDFKEIIPASSISVLNDRISI